MSPIAPMRVQIREVSPRDGLQIEKQWIPTARKIELVDQLSKTGVSGIQITSFVPPKVVPQFKDAEEVARAVSRVPGVRYIALIPNAKGLERAVATGMDEVTLPSAATEAFARKNLNRTVAECIETVAQVVKAAPGGLTISASISMCFGCPYEGMVPVVRVLEVCERIAATGAPILTLGDTAGMGNPALVHEVFGRLRERCPETRLAAHFHDTRGAGLANAVAAWEEGVAIFDGSVGGLGGCPFAPAATGNIATEDLVNMFHGMGIATGVDLAALIAAAVKAEEIVGRQLPGLVKRAGPWPPPAPATAAR